MATFKTCFSLIGLYLYLVEAQLKLNVSENGKCLDKDSFVLISDIELPFEAAQIFCQTQFEIPGNLARISNSKELLIVGNLSEGINVNIGIRATDGAGLGNSSNFFYIDGSEKDLNFIHVESGRFPWSDQDSNFEPNNFGDLEEDCVELRRANGRMNDAVCNDSKQFVCRFQGKEVRKNCDLGLEEKEYQFYSIFLISLLSLFLLLSGLIILLIFQQNKKYFEEKESLKIKFNILI